MWSKIDGTIAHHPKLIAAGPIAAWFYVCGLTYASTYGTDGFIPDTEAPHVTPLDDPQDAIKRLVEAGLWHRRKGGYQIHDFLDYQPSGAKMKAGRIAARRRSAEYRARHSAQPEDVTNGERHASPERHASRHGTNAGSESEVEVELSVNPGPLPPAPPPPDPEARASTPRALRAIPKPHEVERAELEAHQLYEPLSSLFGPVTSRDLDDWCTDLATLDELGAMPEDVPRAAAGYAATMGHDNGRPIAMSRSSLIKHWYRSLHAPLTPSRVTVDGRMPVHGQLDPDKYLNGQYARFFNRPYDDEVFHDVDEASP